MPSYDYTCKNCKNTFTIEKSMNDNITTVCTHCNSTDIVRLWGNIELKGCSKGSSSNCSTSCTKSSCLGCNRK